MHALLIAFLACIAYSLVLSHQINSQHVPSHIGSQVLIQYSLAFVLMLLIWWRTQGNGSSEYLGRIMLIALASRLLLLFIEPYSSNDVDRYLFDGRIALEGLDPYRIPHDAAELVKLREQWTPPPEHAKYVTLYPPLALALFSLSSWFGLEYSLVIWKILTASASIAIVFVGYTVLKHADKLQHFTLLALSPLLVLEAGEGAHLDVFSALAVILTIYSWQRNRFVLAGIFIGVGGLIKMLPVLLAVPLVFLIPRWKNRLGFTAAVSLTLVTAYSLTFLMGFRPIGSINVFFEKWRSGSPFFLWLEPHINGPALLLIAIALVLLSLGLIALYAAFNSRLKLQSPYLLMQLAMAITLLVSPVIFPWYILPVIVLTALRPTALFLTWAFTLPMLYEVLNPFLCCGDWAPSTWPIHLIGISLIIAATYDIFLIRGSDKE